MYTSSRSRAFSILRCCSSNDISPIAAGPPQLGHVALLRASLYLLFSALSLSLSDFRIWFSCLSLCAYINITHNIVRNILIEMKLVNGYKPSSVCVCFGTKTLLEEALN